MQRHPPPRLGTGSCWPKRSSTTSPGFSHSATCCQSPRAASSRSSLLMRLPSKPSWQSSANTFPGTPRHLLMPQSSLMISPQPTGLGKQQCDVHCTGQLSV